MDLKDDFVFRPLPPVKDTIHFPFPIPNPLGPLAVLGGEWGGKGFNMIWRPNHTPGQDRFLELNLTLDSIDFKAISGAIPNRGLLQPDKVAFLRRGFPLADKLHHHFRPVGQRDDVDDRGVRAVDLADILLLQRGLARFTQIIL